MQTGSTCAGQLASALQPFVDRHELAGAVVLVADKDQVRGVAAVGYADIAAGKPMREDAVFWIASQSKSITATALMMLVDEGKVRIEEPVATYLPEFADLWYIAEGDTEHQVLRRPAQPITVRHILSHTSGMPFMSAMEVPTLDLLPLHVAVRSYAMTPLQFAPDSAYAYSNAGINTAGRIIEVVSGMAYEDFLDTRLFQPLGMTDTTFWPNEEQVARLATSYKPTTDNTDLEAISIGQLKYPLSDHSSRYPMPAGGLFSTAADCARFCQMVMNGGAYNGKRYLSEEAVRVMTSKQTRDLDAQYGLGWGLDNGLIGHGGAHATSMNFDPKCGLLYVWLVQHAGYPGEGGKSEAAFRAAAETMGQ